MESDVLKDRDFSKEFNFITSRSSGPGGQKVNKVSTKVELRFNLNTSEILTENEKEIIKNKLKNKINSNGELIISSQTERSQLMNKKKVIYKFYLIITKALTPKKKRKQTKPSIISIEKRLEDKRIQSERKKLRRDIGY
ncbi:MAG: aminoacyl-tRNA hydrolase [Bacteroidales bacterium]|nr:aminoacyl-tRNA hydrolase [Bacteroidales bacterium]